jgi:undecaprenyl diphosphate synthase
MKNRIIFGAVSAALLSVLLFVSVKKVFWQEHEHEVPSLETKLDIPEAAAILPAQNPELTHLACIMDGNRRWAKQQGLPQWEGHKAGIEAARTIVEFCIEKKIKYLTLYTFSSENFNRSQEEINYIFDLMLKKAQEGPDEFKKQDIRLRFIGDRSLFPSQLASLIDQFEKETADCKTLEVSFLFCYGARQEIVAAAKSVAQKVKAGLLKEEDITPELFEDHLWNKNFPDPDLIIRTGHVSRLSNFLLYQAAYSELYMMDCYWPEITKERLQKAYDEFTNIQRRFGT